MTLTTKFTLWYFAIMLVVLLILINGSIVLRRNSNRLRKLLQTNDDRHNGNILQVKQRLGVFQGVELLLFLIIFALSIFRF